MAYCGIAYSSLYQRLQDGVGDVKREQFLFLEPKPLCHPNDDKCVFASNHHQLLKEGIRDFMAPLTPILSLEHRGVQRALTSISHLKRSNLKTNVIHNMMKFQVHVRRYGQTKTVHETIS
jgi:hypothetical protein